MPEVVSAATILALTVPDISQALEGAARLVRLNSEVSRKQNSFAIGKDKVCFGRTIGDTCFCRAFITRSHARVYLRGEDDFPEDQKRSNGTFANRAKKPCLAMQVEKGACAAQR
jgi:pSer/pThr/pTyr-binding forkhead associated (FHA) protein